MQSQITFNALGTEMKDSKETLADKLGIEMPAPDKLEAKVLDTENLAEIVVELSNAKLVKNKDALLNPANYRLNNDVKVQNVHLDGNNVVLTLVPYGKVEDQGKFDSLIKGKKFNLTIRNIDPAINDTYRNIVPGDNAIPVVEEIDFIGTHGIKIVTSEPIANPLERNFRLDSRTSMKVEQYGRNILLTPYHGKEFAKDTVELTIDTLEDFAGYTAVRTVEKMAISTDEDLPKVEAAYRSGKELVVVFDRDVYHDSVKAYENRRELGNASFVERRVPFYAEKAEKVDTNVVKYTFTRDIPRGLEVTIEGVANHFNKTMEKENIVPEEYKDDYAPVIIDFDDAVAVTDEFEDKLAKIYEDDETDGKKEYNRILDEAELSVNTLEMAIEFDKDIAEFIDAKPEDIKVKDHFTLYELDITKRGETIAKEVEINVKDIDKDSIELTFKKIKINNKDRDFDYILEVRNFTDTNRNRMEREYLDFQVVRQGKSFDVTVKDIKNAKYFNRNGAEIVLEFNKYVNKEVAQEAKNYYLDGKLKVDEAIVERDGKTVSLVVYDTDADKLVKDYKVLEISPRVVQLDWPYSAPAHRFFDLKSGDAITDPVADRNAAKKVEGLINALPPEVKEMTLDNEEAVNAAREAYEKLTKVQKELVGKEIYAKLEEAETRIAELKAEKGEKEEEAVEAAVKAINEATDYTIANVLPANAKVLGLDLTDFNALEDKASVYSALGTNKTFVDAAAIKTAFDAAVADQKETEKDAKDAAEALVAAAEKTEIVVTPREADADSATDKGGLGVRLTFKDDFNPSKATSLKVTLYKGNEKLVDNVLNNPSEHTGSTIDSPFNYGGGGHNKWAWTRDFYNLSEDGTPIEPDKVVVEMVVEGETIVVETDLGL